MTKYLHHIRCELMIKMLDVRLMVQIFRQSMTSSLHWRFIPLKFNVLPNASISNLTKFDDKIFKRFGSIKLSLQQVNKQMN